MVRFGPYVLVYEFGLGFQLVFLSCIRVFFVAS